MKSFKIYYNDKRFANIFMILLSEIETNIISWDIYFNQI